MPLFQLPQLISQVINARVALNRIQAFLAADQQPDLPVQPAVEKGGPLAPTLLHPDHTTASVLLLLHVQTFGSLFLVVPLCHCLPTSVPRRQILGSPETALPF